ncbi:MAG: LPP20 family lipoprotein [Treponema sp.]|nr:LPP20 family lipoprotein [Treponema sp.]
MKKIFPLIAVLFLAFLVLGCKSQPASGGSAQVVLPPWINEVPPEDTLWGIGNARQSNGQMSMTLAETRARADIARQLSTIVEGMITDYTRDANVGTANQASLGLQESINRQLSQAQLTGSRRDQLWTAPDGTFWARVVYNKAAAAKFAADSIKNVIDNEAARYAEFKAMEAAKMMDEQLSKYKSDPNRAVTP